MSSKHRTVDTGAFDALLKGTTPPTNAPSLIRLQPNIDKLQPNQPRRAKRSHKASSPAQPRPTPEHEPLTKPPQRSTNRAMLTLRFDPDMLDRARNACYAIDKTFQEVIDSALFQVTQTLEARNGGKPYPPRPGNLKTGPRPTKTQA